jgi:hypothetical protein
LRTIDGRVRDCRSSACAFAASFSICEQMKKKKIKSKRKRKRKK